VRPRHGRAPAALADEQHVFQLGQPPPQVNDLSPVQRLRTHEHARPADPEARVDRLGPEGGEERAEDAPVLERAERGDVELGDPARESADEVVFPDPE